MHPTTLPASASYFDPKRRDAAARRYLEALEAQRIAQYHRTQMLCTLYLIALALGALALVTPGPLGFILCTAATVCIIASTLLR